MKLRLPVTNDALVAVAITVVIALAGYPSVVGRTHRELARLQSQLDALSAGSPATAVNVVPISDSERARWRDLESRVRARFVAPDDQPKAVAEVLELARASGLAVEQVELQRGPAKAAAAMASTPLELPAGLSVTPRAIRLTARHRYAGLLEFLDRLPRAGRYVAVESLDVRRVADSLESDVRLVTVSWRP